MAIKILRSTHGEPARRAAVQLQHEFDCARRLSHPNILRVFDLHSSDGRRFMTMELIDGQLLATVLRDRSKLRPGVVRRILQGCADALTHAHSRNVVHGDFKPGNVFVTTDGNVKVVDFGAAIVCGDDPNDRARMAAATPAYASPEVLEGHVPERRDDVFSFACVAYELLALQHPFEHGRSTDARNAGWVAPRAWSLPAPQWLALLSALAWQRRERTADVGTLLAALMAQPPKPAETLRAAGVKFAPKPLSGEFMRPDRGWTYFLIALLALIVVLIALR